MPPTEPNSGERLEERFADLLTAYDEALISQRTPDVVEPTSGEWAERLRRAQAIVRRLERDRRRRTLKAARQPTETADARGLAFDADGQPTQLDRFSVSRILGRGGTGTVYLAFDPEHEREVAIKIPRPEVLATPSMRRRFLREARTAASLSHPNLVPVYEAGEIGPFCYLVSAYCPGPSLATWLERRPGRLSPPEALLLTSILADAVGSIHDQGVLHRDLKPNNVILVPQQSPPVRSGADISPLIPPVSSCEFAIADASPMITDFGLAKWLDGDDSETRSGTVLGTPRYMAPEQSEGRIHAMGPPTDVYALGVIFYELLTAQTPAWESAASGPALVTPRRLFSDIPREFDMLCRKCLERDPERRFSRGSELASALRDCALRGVEKNWLASIWSRVVDRIRRE
jgi:serine/threonine protein kinase